MMFSVWQDSTGNSLYSYGALVQSTLLPALVAGLAVLRWQDTGHKRWAVLAGYCAFQCCATFEIGLPISCRSSALRGCTPIRRAMRCG